MQYLRCLWIVFLVSGLLTCIKHSFMPIYKNKSDDESIKLFVNIIVWIFGGLWLYLLLIFFGITI